INLLAEGKRAVTRKAKGPALALQGQKVPQYLLLAGALLGVLASGLGWFYYSHQIAKRDAKIAEANKEIERLSAILKEGEQFKKEKAELERKIHVINDLKENQRGPVKIMDQVSRALPELLWLDRMDVVGNNITLNGEAFNTNAVANFIENLDKVQEFSEPI